MIKNRYDILQTLNKGDMATTYLAYDTENKCKVVVKELEYKKVKEWKAIDLFEREYKTLKQVNHLNVPDFVDFFKIESEQDIKFYIVQTYFKGVTLKEYIYEKERLTEKKAIFFLKKLLAIISYLHGLNPPIIHRDIKPENIIIDDHEEIYLVDFGSVNSTEKNEMTIVGTYGYMPLEQFGGQTFLNSDIYALGMVMIFWLTHKNPADLPKKNGRLYFQHNCSLSDTFSSIIEKMIEPDYSVRYKKCDEIIYDLENMHQKPEKEKTFTHSKKMSKKEKKIVNISLIFFVLIVALLWIIALVNKENQQEENERMRYILKSHYNESDIYKNRKKPSMTKPLPGGFRKALFGMNLNKIKKIYPDIKLDVPMTKYKEFLNLFYYKVGIKDIYMQKIEVMGYDFNAYFLFKKNQLFRVVLIALLESENIFNQLERNILNYLEKNYGFAYKAKVSNTTVNRRFRDDWYLWESNHTRIKYKVKVHIVDPIFKKNISFMKDSYKIVLEYTSMKIIHEIEKEKKQEELKREREELKRQEEMRKKELERLKKIKTGSGNL